MVDKGQVVWDVSGEDPWKNIKDDETKLEDEKDFYISSGVTDPLAASDTFSGGEKWRQMDDHSIYGP